MKNIFKSILSLAVIVFLFGCSHNNTPQFRIHNDQSSKVNVKVQTSGSGNFTINDVEPGQTTSYQIAPEGNITATDVIQNESISFLAKKNTQYTIVINTGKPPSLKMDE